MAPVTKPTPEPEHPGRRPRPDHELPDEPRDPRQPRPDQELPPEPEPPPVDPAAPSKPTPHVDGI